MISGRKACDMSKVSDWSRKSA